LMRLLTVNAGSSSVKVSMLDGDTTVVEARLPAPGAGTVEPLRRLLEEQCPEATVHRIVHGGHLFREAIVVDQGAESQIEALADLAPLHNPPALTLLDQVWRLAPQMPAVACFDTAFFADMPEVAATYAVPEEWRVRLGVRRFGFHGLSHAWVAERVPNLVGRPVQTLRLVSAHIGAGASLAAISGGKALDTTMGFTPLEGLVMATRCGSIDPGIVTHLIRADGISPDDMEDILEHRSGLRGLAGTDDLAKVIEAADAGEPRAILAYGVYVHRLRGAIAAMVAAMDGLDALCFTGGAGEASTVMRADVCAGLGFLGCSLDAEANAGAGDRVISPGSEPAVVVLHAREDLVMAREATALLEQRGVP